MSRAALAAVAATAAAAFAAGYLVSKDDGGDSPSAAAGAIEAVDLPAARIPLPAAGGGSLPGIIEEPRERSPAPATSDPLPSAPAAPTPAPVTPPPSTGGGGGGGGGGIIEG